MNAWQFLDSLPDAVWYVSLSIVGLLVLLVFGGGVASVLVTLVKGGKVKVSKEGIEEATAPEEPDAPK